MTLIRMRSERDSHIRKVTLNSESENHPVFFIV